MVKAPKQRRGGENGTPKWNLEHLTAEDKKIMKEIIIPQARIGIATDAGNYGETGTKKVDDPWVTPSVDAVNRLWRKHVDDGREFGEKDAIPVIVCILNFYG